MSLSLEDYRSEVGITKWIAEVGVTDAPVPRRGLSGVVLRGRIVRIPTHSIRHSEEPRSGGLTMAEIAAGSLGPAATFWASRWA